MPTFPSGARDITTAQEASAAAKGLENVQELAVDVEMDAMHAFHARLCFVQLGTDTEVFLFDTLADGVSLKGLTALFLDPMRTKYFHAAGGDLQFLAEAGIRVQGLFDTHRAATLLGWPKVGLADLAQERLGVQLQKDHQQSDFSLRPLPPAMRAYIADDVRYLCEIGRQVRKACEEAGILEEVLLDCERLAKEAEARPDLLSAYRPKVPKGGSPTDRAFIDAAARALHAKRLEWAEAANVPMGRMLSNAALSELVTRPPDRLDRLKRVPNVRGPLVREHGEEVIELLKSLRERATQGELPAPEDDNPRDPTRRKREDALKEFRAAKAAERKVTGSVILTNPLIDELAAHPPRTLDELGRVPYFGTKRLSLYGHELLTLLKKWPPAN